MFIAGDIKTALDWTLELLKLDPKHSRALGNIPYFKKLIAEEKAEQKKLQRGVRIPFLSPTLVTD